MWNKAAGACPGTRVLCPAYVGPGAVVEVRPDEAIQFQGNPVGSDATEVVGRGPLDEEANQYKGGRMKSSTENHLAGYYEESDPARCSVNLAGTGVVQHIFEAYSKGISPGQIAKELQNRGNGARPGPIFKAKSVRRILRRWT